MGGPEAFVGYKEKDSGKEVLSDISNHRSPNQANGSLKTTAVDRTWYGVLVFFHIQAESD